MLGSLDFEHLVHAVVHPQDRTVRVIHDAAGQQFVASVAIDVVERQSVVVTVVRLSLHVLPEEMQIAVVRPEIQPAVLEILPPLPQNDVRRLLARECAGRGAQVEHVEVRLRRGQRGAREHRARGSFDDHQFVLDGIPRSCFPGSREAVDEPAPFAALTGEHAPPDTFGQLPHEFPVARECAELPPFDKHIEPPGFYEVVEDRLSAEVGKAVRPHEPGSRNARAPPRGLRLKACEPGAVALRLLDRLRSFEAADPRLVRCSEAEFARRVRGVGDLKQNTALRDPAPDRVAVEPNRQRQVVLRLVERLFG